MITAIAHRPLLESLSIYPAQVEHLSGDLRIHARQLVRDIRKLIDFGYPITFSDNCVYVPRECWEDYKLMIGR